MSHLTGSDQLADSDASFSYTVKTVSGGECVLGAIDESGYSDRDVGE